MRTVVLGERPAPVEEWLERRQALGQDLFDEVWEGEYHVAPAPRPQHGDLDHQLVVVLHPAARRVGLRGSGPLNVGGPDDYRVPDQAYLRERPTDTFVPSAAIVVEIVSPGDESYDKFDFYLAHGVEEVLIVDYQRRAVEWYARGTDGFERRDASALLSLSEDDLAADIDWPES